MGLTLVSKIRLRNPSKMVRKGIRMLCMVLPRVGTE